jgi:hypothetical protein
VSNYLAIAVVSAALQELVQAAVQPVVPGAVVRVGPPRAVAPGEKDVNIYLYRIAANPYLRNAELPLREADGTGIGRSVAAVDLHYVISFGGEEHLASEVMMGKVAAVLHAKPVLGFEKLARIAAAGGAFPFLEQGYSITQQEKLTLTPEYLSLDELSKLWSVFFQLTHRPSLQFIASPVLIDADILRVAVPKVGGVNLGAA